MRPFREEPKLLNKNQIEMLDIAHKDGNLFNIFIGACISGDRDTVEYIYFEYGHTFTDECRKDMFAAVEDLRSH